MIPLCLSPNLFAFKRRLSESYPFWQGIEVTKQATYFGILVGPDVTAEQRWAESLAKYLSRALLISSAVWDSVRPTP